MNRIRTLLFFLFGLCTSSFVRLRHNERWNSWGFRAMDWGRRPGDEIFIQTLFSDTSVIDSETREFLLFLNRDNISITPTETFGDLTVPLSMIADSFPSEQRNEWILGLTPSSLAVHYFGPITIVHNEDYSRMYTYSNMEFFHSNCLENSTIDFPADHDDGPTTSVSFYLVDTYGATFVDSISRPYPLRISSIGRYVLLTVPAAIRATIVEELLRLGAEEIIVGSDVLSNCNETVISGLPTIVLHIERLSANGDKVVIGPTDYLTIFTDQGHCDLRLSVIEESDELETAAAAIDFFKLSHINLYISPDGISVCDSL